MKQTYCDRCGELIPDVSYHTIEMKRWNRGTDSHDICNDCFNMVEEFLTDNSIALYHGESA